MKTGKLSMSTVCSFLASTEGLLGALLREDLLFGADTIEIAPSRELPCWNEVYKDVEDEGALRRCAIASLSDSERLELDSL